MPLNKVSIGKKVQLTNGLILLTGTAISVYLYLNPPEMENKTSKADSVENAWMISALLTVSLILIIYSIYILRKNKK